MKITKKKLLNIINEELAPLALEDYQILTSMLTNYAEGHDEYTTNQAATAVNRLISLERKIGEVYEKVFSSPMNLATERKNNPGQKITRKKLQNIIKEEILAALSEKLINEKTEAGEKISGKQLEKL